MRTDRVIAVPLLTLIWPRVMCHPKSWNLDGKRMRMDYYMVS